MNRAIHRVFKNTNTILVLRFKKELPYHRVAIIVKLFSYTTFFTGDQKLRKYIDETGRPRYVVNSVQIIINGRNKRVKRFSTEICLMFIINSIF